jgi:RND family efflux transporter MFP subunit
MGALSTGEYQMRDLGRAARRLASLALVASLGASLAACGGQKQEDKAPQRTALTVTAQTVNLEPLPRKVDASGTVAAWQEVPVSSETGGLEVTAVLVDEGSKVRQGQQLVQLDDRVLRAQVRQSEAAVVSAEAVLAQNQAALKRSVDLKSKGFLAQSALDTAVANQKTAEAQVLTAKAALGEAQAKLDQSVIRAPVSGTITTRTVVKGQVINVGTELFRLVRDDQLEMEAQVPEADVPLVHAGMASVVSGDQGTTVGRVRLMTPQVDPTTRLGLARITLPPNSPFRPGNFGTASIDVGAVPTLTVPEGAIVFRDGKPGVYVIQPGNKVRFVQVVTGDRSNGTVAIRSGLQPGSTVVTQGGGFLGDGDKVAIAAALPKTGA